jgi:hypothetical protein
LATLTPRGPFPPRQTALFAGQGSEVPKTALRHLREGAKEIPPREAAERVLRGERPAVKGARDLAYLEEVARALHALKRRREVEERVNRLLTARPDATVSPEDEAVIFGRLRSGHPVWVRATPEELKALREKAVDRLLRSRPSYLSGAYRYTSRMDLPHPRVRQALRAVWDWVKGEAEGARVLEAEEKRAWVHRAVGEDYELEVLLALGLEADWTDPAEVRALLEPLARDPSLLPEELDLSGASLAAQEAADVAKREGLLRVVRRVHRRCLPGGARKAEAPHRAVARVLGGLKLLPQEEVRKLHEEVLEGKRRGLWKAAAQAMPAALEVLLGFPVLYDEMLALAWEWSVRAVEEQRSLKHHPAAPPPWPPGSPSWRLPSTPRRAEGPSASPRRASRPFRRCGRSCGRAPGPRPRRWRGSSAGPWRGWRRSCPSCRGRRAWTSR